MALHGPFAHQGAVVVGAVAADGDFALLAVVGGKLLLFDASGRGTVTWTLTLIGVALLVLAASYFAPLPPRAEAMPEQARG